MNPTGVTFKALSKSAMVPKRQTAGAAGYDLHSISTGTIPPLGSARVRTGFSLNIPFNLFGIVLGRSGLAVRHGIEVKASYVKNGEEIVVHLHNNGDTPFSYEKHMRIAQLIFARMDNDAEYVGA